MRAKSFALNLMEVEQTSFSSTVQCTVMAQKARAFPLCWPSIYAET